MKIQYTERWSTEANTAQISDLVERHCDGHGYDTGATEAAQAIADKCAELLGHLFETLASKGALTAPEIFSPYASRQREQSKSESEALAEIRDLLGCGHGIGDIVDSVRALVTERTACGSPRGGRS